MPADHLEDYHAALVKAEAACIADEKRLSKLCPWCNFQCDGGRETCGDDNCLKLQVGVSLFVSVVFVPSSVLLSRKRSRVVIPFLLF